MTDANQGRLTVAELEHFFDRLFPFGAAGPDVLAEIAPEGWLNSPLLACFHPSAEQLYQETLQVHRNVEQLLAQRRRSAGEPEAPPGPSRHSRRSAPAEIDREARRNARLSPPPEVVRAYEIVYGRVPRGWPPA